MLSTEHQSVRWSLERAEQMMQLVQHTLCKPQSAEYKTGLKYKTKSKQSKEQLMQLVSASISRTTQQERLDLGQ